MAGGEFAQSKPSAWHLIIGWFSSFVLAAGARSISGALGEFDS
jgi:hypothetical protein